MRAVPLPARLAFLILLAFGVAPSGCVPDPAAPAASGTFSALTYNIAGLPEGISQSKPKQYIPLIGPLLNSYDLVCVQEDFVYHHLLDPGARHAYRSQPQAVAVAFMNDGLNRYSRFAIHGFTRQRWYACHGFVKYANDCLAAKGFSYARHEVATGVFVDLYNLHADAGSAAGDVEARKRQFEQLERYLRIFSAGHAVVVCGDTNLRASDSRDEAVLFGFLSRTGLKDAARHLKTGVEKIDRFLFRSGKKVQIEPLRWRIATEFTTSSGAPLSDHLAIHVDFRWKTVP